MDELHEALGTMTERLGGAEGAEQNPDDGLPDKQATSFIVKKAIAYIEQNYAKNSPCRRSRITATFHSGTCPS